MLKKAPPESPIESRLQTGLENDQQYKHFYVYYDPVYKKINIMNIKPHGNITLNVIEQVLPQIHTQKKQKEHIEFDLTDVSFFDPGGVIGFLDLIRFLSRQNLDISVRNIPEAVSSYLEKINFWHYYRCIQEETKSKSPGSQNLGSEVLLGITQITEHEDVTRSLQKVGDRAGSILKHHLHYPSEELDRFLTAFSEICQNVVEHSEDIGTVAAQKYYYQKRLGKNVVKLAVSDLGVGIRNTLSNTFKETEEHWNDRVAIRKALFEGTSRFAESGRGHGLTSVRHYTNQWDGRLTIRSGKAKLSIVPDWDTYPEVEENLPHFPGTQVILVLPEKEKREPQKQLFPEE